MLEELIVAVPPATIPSPCLGIYTRLSCKLRSHETIGGCGVEIIVSRYDDVATSALTSWARRMVRFYIASEVCVQGCTSGEYCQ